MCRCGEDERPLNELLILQLGADHPNGRYNISMCKNFGNHWNQEKRRFLRGVENNMVIHFKKSLDVDTSMFFWLLKLVVEILFN